MAESDETTDFRVMAALNPETREGGVVLQINDRRHAMKPNDAKMLAMTLLGAADAADCEADLLNLAMQEQGMNYEQASEHLARFRSIRTARAQRDSKRN